jgi:hypothetical protein
MLMRSCVLTNVSVFLFLLLAWAASAEEPRILLDRAIQAHGGAARVERTKKGHLKAKSEGKQSNAPFKVEIEEWFDLPSRYRETSDGSRNGMPYHGEKLVLGKEGWIREGTGPMRPFPFPDPFVAQHWHAKLALLLVLRDKDVQFKSLPDETKDGRSLVGFHAISPQVADDFFFDKSTGLLAKTQKTMPNPLGGQEVIEEAFYDDYRDIQSIHFPTCFKITVRTTYSATITLSFIEFSDKIGESVFKKPQMPVADEPASENSAKTPVSRDRMLIVATVGAGVTIGAVWFIVRASKRGKRETPPS